MFSLYGTVPFTKLYHVSGLIRKYLYFNMSGVLYVFFDIHLIISETHFCFCFCFCKELSDLAFIICPAYSSSPASGAVPAAPLAPFLRR